MQRSHITCFVLTLLASLGLTQAHASDKGCGFLLCMAAPNPMSIPDCAKIVNGVRHDLMRGKGLPSCNLYANADGSLGGKDGIPTIKVHKGRRHVYLTTTHEDGTTTTEKMRRF